MSRAKSALLSGVVWFVIGFAVAAVVGDRKSGLKAGAVSAVVGALLGLVVATLVGDDAGDLEEIEELAEEVDVSAD